MCSTHAAARRALGTHLGQARYGHGAGGCTGLGGCGDRFRRGRGRGRCGRRHATPGDRPWTSDTSVERDANAKQEAERAARAGDVLARRDQQPAARARRVTSPDVRLGQARDRGGRRRLPDGRRGHAASRCSIRRAVCSSRARTPSRAQACSTRSSSRPNRLVPACSGAPGHAVLCRRPAEPRPAARIRRRPSP